MPASSPKWVDPNDTDYDSDDGDLDLDLHELDPATGHHASHGRNGASIAMHPINFGSLRRPRQGGYGDMGRDRNEDMAALLSQSDDDHGKGGHGADGHRDGGDGDDDHEPLLSGNEADRNGSRLLRKGPPYEKGRRRRLPRIRLPAFLSSSAKSKSPLGGKSPRSARPPAAEKKTDPSISRTVSVGIVQSKWYPANIVSNAKYTAFTFLPITLYNEFSFFFNMYFLLVALSQIIPQLRIGYLSTYIAPLAFVLCITMGKEAFDDIARRRRDSEANSEPYTVLSFDSNPQTSTVKPQFRRNKKGKSPIEEGQRHSYDPGNDHDAAASTLSSTSVQEVVKLSKDITVGDVLKLSKGQRVPADVVILKCISGEEERLRSRYSLSLPIPDSQKEHESASQTNNKPIDLLSPVTDVGGDSPTSSQPPSSEGEAITSGETFIRTDQLDGETDWKLRLAPPVSQKLPLEALVRFTVSDGKLEKKINEFAGTLKLHADSSQAQSSQSQSTTEAQPLSSFPSTAATVSPLSIDNTAWANTVIASQGVTYAVVLYTGPQTRSALSTAPSRSKTGLLEYEINSLTKILCFLTLALSGILVALEGVHGPDSGNNDGEKGNAWYIKVMRFLVLFSTIVPISLRVNLDMGKSAYSYFIQHDASIPGAVVRTSTIPEDLGRIEYLLSDKTGTLTQNEMEMKKIHVGTVSYANEAMEEVSSYVHQGFRLPPSSARGDGRKPNNTTHPLVTPTISLPQHSSSAASSAIPGGNSTMAATTRSRRDIGSRVRDVVLALALCHNVTPTTEDDVHGQPQNSYQASSPDEIAIVKWTESVGLRLAYRDRRSIVLESTAHSDPSRNGAVVVQVRILDIFPFTSEGKRMGIIVQFLEHASPTNNVSLAVDFSEHGGEIWFYQKGADTVMGSIVAVNDWLEEETANMAREGLRTLVVGRKRLSHEQYREFSQTYREASLAISQREARIQQVVTTYLERDLELLGVTGVEDKLQRDVKPSLELLRNAGIKIWMLTGDKVETARCVAVSSKLVARGQLIYTLTKMTPATAAAAVAADAAVEEERGSSLPASSSISSPHPHQPHPTSQHQQQQQQQHQQKKLEDMAKQHLDFLSSKPDSCLLIDGESLATFLAVEGLRRDFIRVAVRLPTVVACRCSPTQKAEVAELIKAHTGRRVCCIGDGGNDVSMIQAADVGVGIVGKEGRQASLAADFSIEHFFHLTKLLVWHGRNSYKRSAKLAQFVIHRGLIIAVCQTMYSIAIKFEPEGLYKDWLLVGYATVYTAMPVLSLVLDKDVDENLASLYPELYKELTSGRSLSYRTFFVWVFVSVYQGSMIQGLSQLLTEVDGPRMVAVGFTALVLNELLMVAMEVTTWHPIMIASLVGTFVIYAVSVPFLGDYFDLAFVITWGFVWRILAIGAISLIPTYAAKVIRRTMKPPSYRKVQSY